MPGSAAATVAAPSSSGSVTSFAVGGTVSGKVGSGPQCDALGEVYTVTGPDAQALFDEASLAVPGSDGAIRRIALTSPYAGSNAELPPPSATNPCRGLTVEGQCLAGTVLRCLRPRKRTSSTTSAERGSPAGPHRLHARRDDLRDGRGRSGLRFR